VDGIERAPGQDEPERQSGGPGARARPDFDRHERDRDHVEVGDQRTRIADRQARGEDQQKQQRRTGGNGNPARRRRRRLEMAAQVVENPALGRLDGQPLSAGGGAHRRITPCWSA
jgi:hypothetical protein